MSQHRDRATVQGQVQAQIVEEADRSYQPECGKAWTCSVVINSEWRYVGKCLLSLHQFENLGLKYIGKS